MSITEHVYRCIDDEINADLTACYDDTEQWRKLLITFRAKHFPRQTKRGVTRREGFSGEETLVGFQHLSDKDGRNGEKLPEGWKLGKDGYVIADYKTKLGRAFVKEVDAINVHRPRSLWQRIANKGQPPFITKAGPSSGATRWSTPSTPCPSLSPRGSRSGQVHLQGDVPRL